MLSPCPFYFSVTALLKLVNIRGEMCGFTITNIAQEHLTHSWSHFQQHECGEGAYQKEWPELSH